jgi:hypothetical protein
MNQMVKFAKHRLQGIAGRSNIERRMNVFYLFLKRFREAIPSFVLRHSIFCGSLFNPGHRSGQFNHQEIVPFLGSFIQAEGNLNYPLSDIILILR